MNSPLYSEIFDIFHNKKITPKMCLWGCVDILGISELKWTGMGEFNSDDHCIN